MTRTKQLFLSALLLAILTPAVAGQSTTSPAASNQPSPAAKAPSGGTASDSDPQATRQDLQKMRIILNQMRNNLAFVGSTTTPLNHQFELDIEMWQALLDQMERRINQSGDGSHASKPQR